MYSRSSFFYVDPLGFQDANSLGYCFTYGDLLIHRLVVDITQLFQDHTNVPLLRNYFDHRRQTLCERAILTFKVPHWILFSLPYSSLLFLSTSSSEYSPLYAKFSITSCAVRFHSPSDLLTTVPTHFRFQNRRIAGPPCKKFKLFSPKKTSSTEKSHCTVSGIMSYCGKYLTRNVSHRSTSAFDDCLDHHIVVLKIFKRAQW